MGKVRNETAKSLGFAKFVTLPSKLYGFAIAFNLVQPVPKNFFLLLDKKKEDRKFDITAYTKCSAVKLLPKGGFSFYIQEYNFDLDGKTKSKFITLRDPSEFCVALPFLRGRLNERAIFKYEKEAGLGDKNSSLIKAFNSYCLEICDVVVANSMSWGVSFESYLRTNHPNSVNIAELLARDSNLVSLLSYNGPTEEDFDYISTLSFNQNNIFKDSGNSKALEITAENAERIAEENSEEVEIEIEHLALAGESIPPHELEASFLHYKRRIRNKVDPKFFEEALFVFSDLYAATEHNLRRSSTFFDLDKILEKYVLEQKKGEPSARPPKGAERR